MLEGGHVGMLSISHLWGLGASTPRTEVPWEATWWRYLHVRLTTHSARMEGHALMWVQVTPSVFDLCCCIEYGE